MRLKPTFWCVAGAAIGLAACGNHAQSSTSAERHAARAQALAAAAASTPNACAVLTEAIAKKYLGAGATLKRDAHPNPRMSICQYASDRGEITVESGSWDDVNTKLADDKVLAGLGDEAHVGPMGLFVRKGDHGLNIDIITKSGEFWGSAADDMMMRNQDAEKKVAPDLVAND